MRKNPSLWAECVDEVKSGDKAGPAGTWNARKAQLAVNLYKQRGGKYSGKRGELSQWTKEDWGYIDGVRGNRYLPKAVRDSLTPQEKREENRRKRLATSRGSQRAKYSPSVAAKLSRSRSRKSKKR